jgi:hypothetical protein
LRTSPRCCRSSPTKISRARTSPTARSRRAYGHRPVPASLLGHGTSSGAGGRVLAGRASLRPLGNSSRPLAKPARSRLKFAYVSSGAAEAHRKRSRAQGPLLPQGSRRALGHRPLPASLYAHTAHHRGQAVVYLRVKGITPPTWKFEPTASEAGSLSIELCGVDRRTCW